MAPALQGIQDLSHGRPLHLDEQGELAEINAGLNRAAAYMTRKDNTRAEWIRGVSHDIRTPLSMRSGTPANWRTTFFFPRRQGSRRESSAGKAKK